MKITKAGFQYINEPNKTKKIERIARICYKSEDKIADSTDIKMLNNLIKRQHLAMLEHADTVFQIKESLYRNFKAFADMMNGSKSNERYTAKNTPKNCYLRFTDTILATANHSQDHRYLISGNFRAWYDFTKFLYDYQPNLCKLYNDTLQYINLSIAGILSEFLDNTTYHSSEFIWEINDLTALTNRERMTHERFTVLFTADRGITHELVRMREASFAQESTRYCNYAAGKYESEISVISPYLWENNVELYDTWQKACETANEYYNKLIAFGAAPQMARSVLPHSTKVDIAITANLTEWKHIFALRACDATGPAHPQIKEIMIPLLKDLQAKHAYDFAFGDLNPAEWR